MLKRKPAEPLYLYAHRRMLDGEVLTTSTFGHNMHSMVVSIKRKFGINVMTKKEGKSGMEFWYSNETVSLFRDTDRTIQHEKPDGHVVGSDLPVYIRLENIFKEIAEKVLMDAGYL